VIAKRGDGHKVTFNVGQRSNDTRGTIRQGFVMRIVEFCGRARGQGPCDRLMMLRQNADAHSPDITNARPRISIRRGRKSNE